MSEGEYIAEYIRVFAEPLIQEIRVNPEVGKELMALIASALLAANFNDGKELE